MRKFALPLLLLAGTVLHSQYYEERVAAMNASNTSVPGSAQQDAYPPAAQNAYPPAENAAPGQQDAYPPAAQNAYPPAENAAPGQQDAYPPAQNTVDAYPPAQNAYPPAENAALGQQDAYPPAAQNAYPPAENIDPNQQDAQALAEEDALYLDEEQDYTPEEEVQAYPGQGKAAPRPENYPSIDPNKVKGIIIQMPFTNITLTPPYAPYQTYDVSRMKSDRIPNIVSSQSLLQNLDKTSWRLKFYSHPGIDQLDSVRLDIREPEITVTTIAKQEASPNFLGTGQPAGSSIRYRLTLVRGLRPGEGIYAYDAGQGKIHFFYIRLIMPHLLAFDMSASYDDIALCPDKSLSDLGVFTLE